MLAQARIRLENAESAISFMQREHTKTLQGLHQEIQALKHKCAELSFQLTIQNVHKEDNPDVNRALEAKLTLALNAKEDECERLRLHLLEKEDEVKILTKRVETSETRRLEEARDNEKRLRTLLDELELKSNSNAQLAIKLHQAKKRLQKFVQGSGVDVRASSASRSGRCDDRSLSSPAGVPLAPHPPQQPRLKATRSSSHLVVKATDVSRPSAPPNAEEFLQTMRIRPVVVKEPAPVLPPIGGGSSAGGRRVKRASGAVKQETRDGEDVNQIIKDPNVSSTSPSWHKVSQDTTD